MCSVKKTFLSLLIVAWTPQLVTATNKGLSQADSLYEAGQYNAAESLLLSEQESSLDLEDFHAYLQACTLLVRVYEELGVPQKQASAIESGLRLGRQHLPNSSLIGSLTMMQGEMEVGGGNLEKGKRSLEKALEILRLGEDAEDLVWCICNLSIMHYLEGDLSSAEAYVQEGRAICKTRLPSNHEANYTLLDLGAMIYMRNGNYNRALEIAVASKDFQKLNFEPTADDSLELGNTLNSIASIYYLTGDYPQAISYFEKAISLFHAAGDKRHPRLGPTLNNLGMALKKEQRTEEAFTTLLEAQELLKTPSNIQAAKEAYVNLTNLTALELLQNDVQSAEGFLEEAFRIVKQWGFDHSFPLYYSGEIYEAQGKPELALKQYNLSLRTLQESGHSQDVLTAPKHLALGRVFQQLGKGDSALIHFQLAINSYAYGFSSLDIAQNPGSEIYFPDPRILTALLEKGNSLFEMWKKKGEKPLLEFALETFNSGIDIFHKFRFQYLHPESRQILSESGVPLFEGAIRSSLDLFSETGAQVLVNNAFILADQPRALGLLEAHRAAEAKEIPVIPEHLRQEEQLLKRNLVFYQSQILKEEQKGLQQDSLRLATWKGILFETERSLETWEQEVRKAYPAYLARKHREPSLQLQDVQRHLLAPGEILVEYFVGKQEVISFWVSHSGVKFTRISRSNAFDREVGRLYHSLSDPTFVHDSTEANYKQFCSSSHQLYQLLLSQGLRAHSNVQRLTIVRDGLLNRLPFEVLIKNPPSSGQVDFLSLDYLIKSFPVRYAPSTTLLLETVQRPNNKQNSECLALAPSYQTEFTKKSIGELRSLKKSTNNLEGALEEVQVLAELGIQGHFLAGEHATEGQFKILAPRYQILHLAMHGEANMEQSEYSRLLFAPTADTCEDSFLYAYELNAIPLACELAILSACESGTGKIHPGEGSMSLGRSFMEAGTQSVIYTLWQINDLASKKLIRSLFQYLKAGNSSSNSLHLAKLDFLQNADSRLAHPFYWAGFISNGSSVPLPKSEGNWGLIVILTILIWIVGQYRLQ